MKHNKIALIGMMGCGKSSIGKLLAKKLNFSLIELDEIFERENNVKIKDFFTKFGEEEFRLKEQALLKRFSNKENIVISCGGGIILKKENQETLFNSDITTIYLKASIDTLFERLKTNKERPLLLVENLKDEIQIILSKREELYKKAKIQINTDNKTKEEIAEEIYKIICTN